MIQQADKADLPEEVTSSDLQNAGITSVVPQTLIAFTNLG